MRRKILIFVGLLSLASAFWVATPVHALNAASGQTSSVQKGETIDATVYRTGRIVTIAGNVNGDVFCAGQQVEISGTVQGDVLCAGQEIRISGTVKGDVRVAGQNITLTGMVDGSFSVAAQTLNIEKGAQIGRDLSVAGQTMRLAGAVGRDAALAGDISTLVGTVGRNTDASLKGVSVHDEARIGGNFTYTSPAEARISSQAVITGKTTHNTPAPEQAQSGMGRLSQPLIMVLVIGLIALVSLLVLPRWTKATSTFMRRQPVFSLGIGFVGLVFTPIAAIILFVTIIGIPFAIFLLITWTVILGISLSFTALTVGEWLFAKIPKAPKDQPFTAALLGTLLLVLLMTIPYFGWLIGFAAVLWGIGGVFCSIFHSIKAQHAAAPSSKKS